MYTIFKGLMTQIKIMYSDVYILVMSYSVLICPIVSYGVAIKKPNQGLLLGFMSCGVCLRLMVS